MNRRLLFILALGALTGAALAQTESASDGPRARFDDDLIANLEGDWLVARQIRGTTVENSARASWVLNHQFLQLHMRDVAVPPKYEAIVLIGYINSDKRYVAHWTDTFGGKASAVGRGIRNGNSIEFRFEYPDGPFFNVFTWHPERKQWVFRMEGQAMSGQRQLFAIDTLTPAK